MGEDWQIVFSSTGQRSESQPHFRLTWSRLYRKRIDSSSRAWLDLSIVCTTWNSHVFKTNNQQATVRLIKKVYKASNTVPACFRNQLALQTQRPVSFRPLSVCMGKSCKELKISYSQCALFGWLLGSQLSRTEQRQRKEKGVRFDCKDKEKTSGIGHNVIHDKGKL